MYLVIFEDEDGTILKEEMVRKGSSATPPEVPSKPSTNKYDYVVKWSESFNNIQSDKLIVLSYEAVEFILLHSMMTTIMLFILLLEPMNNILLHLLVH